MARDTMIDSEPARESSPGKARSNATRAVRRAGGSHLARSLVGVLTLQIGTCHPVARAAYPVLAVPTDAEPSQVPTRLRVAVDPLIEDASLISGWVMSRHPDLDDALSGSAEGWIAVEITGATYDYRVVVVAMRDDKVVGVAETRSCECTNEDLLDLVDGEIEAGLGRFRAMSGETPSRSMIERIHVAPTPVRGAAFDRSLTWPGYAGIGAGIFGLGLMAAGTPLAVRTDEIRLEGEEIQTRSTRGVGVGLAMIGGTALVVGAGLLIFDVVRMRKKAGPMGSGVGRRRVGFTFTWHF